MMLGMFCGKKEVSYIQEFVWIRDLWSQHTLLRHPILYFVNTSLLNTSLIGNLDIQPKLPLNLLE